MVLSNRKPSSLPGIPVVQGSPGVTLVELIVASLMTALLAGICYALFRDVAHAARRMNGRERERASATAFFGSLAENLRTGRGVLSVAPQNLILLNTTGKKMEYRWGDSVLSVNGTKIDMQFISLEIQPVGPARRVLAGMSRRAMLSWDLDSLDDDRDGEIDAQELDRDRSGDLDVTECRLAAGYWVSLTTLEADMAWTQRIFVHPRNHLIKLPEETLADSSLAEF